MLTASTGGMTAIHQLQSAVVGTASDIWIASIISLAAALAALAIRNQLFRWLQAATFLSIAVLLAAHHSYVEFYRTPVLAFHMRYLLDPEFLSSSSSTAMTPMAGFNLIIAAVAWWAAIKAARSTDSCLGVKTSTAKIMSMATVMLAATAIHAFQIRYRVQWFVPGTLQFHVLEKLAIDYARGIDVPLPTRGEVELFSAAFPVESLADDLKDSTTIHRKNPAESQSQSARQLRQALRDSFTDSINKGRKPVLAIMALESFRPSEIDIYASHKRHHETDSVPQLTPNFNSLAKNSVLFREAFSSGTVTCSGQEALWCGYQSGLYNSLMRARPDLKIKCLPHVFKTAQGLPMWIHNGQGKFDNQVSFWRNQGVSHFITMDDFPPETPDTSWGVGDLALADRAAAEIGAARSKDVNAFVAPFILTVTNHIPWGLPADAPQEIRGIIAPYGQNTRMWQTTAYTDLAIGRFVTAAKKSGFWDQMLLVLASDHGNKEKPRHATGPSESDSTARLQSHMALMLSGGLIEKALQKSFTNQALREITWPVGQAGVAALLEFIASGNASGHSPDVLNWPDGFPVISDQNDGIYLPALNQTFPRSALRQDLSGKFPEEDVASAISARKLALIRFKILANSSQSN